MKRLLFLILVLISLSSHAQKTKCSLKIGQKAPRFVALDQNGVKIKSTAILKEKQLIVVFYRGQWCPFCNRHLSELQDHLEDFKKAGAQLIAITPEKTENIDKTIEKTKADFPILWDKDNLIMKTFGVDFILAKDLQERYKQYGVDLNKANGNPSQTLPVPATFVIGKNGKIKFIQYDPNYKNRSTAQEILNHLK
ncbi:AhpC/TSA family protein [Ancylomarina salipaludis]|uniref:thioredoxin-dependent peroxiredoxin n=1 Tax=Ancylomarina salipaludis TaxID=2501299 RepID=A0A4Q1JLS8_9BACT|nr:peroxiredoxin-like family protein [Ancylomarina salipaludis]RXQ93889.1 AhpC/TSA family protein [Ancylomarina salipaludis]